MVFDMESDVFHHLCVKMEVMNNGESLSKYFFSREEVFQKSLGIVLAGMAGTSFF
jgi:hypothetical protein